MDKSDNEYESAPEVYYIPPNFSDAGGVFGGKLKTRNAVEAAAIVGPIAYFEVNHLHFGFQWNLMIGMVTIIPLAAICLLGIHGESLTQILFAYIRFKRHRRILHYDSFAGADHHNETKNHQLTFDSIMDSIATDGLKKAFEKFKNGKSQVTIVETSNGTEKPNDCTTSAEAAAEYTNTDNPVNPCRTSGDAKTGAIRKAKRENKFLSSAKRERFLEKLELGKDEEE